MRKAINHHPPPPWSPISLSVCLTLCATLTQSLCFFVIEGLHALTEGPPPSSALRPGRHRHLATTTKFSHHQFASPSCRLLPPSTGAGDQHQPPESGKKMTDFQTSTHKSKWIFTQQQLIEKHKAANQRAVQSLQKYGTTRLEVDADGSFSYPKTPKELESNGDKHSRAKPLKVGEEMALRVFYEYKIPYVCSCLSKWIQDVCKARPLPHKIQATALTYYKRFYLCWSVMEHHPISVMLSCIYLACKTEENYVSAEDIGKYFNEVDHQIILDYEMLVLQSLGFDLIVYTPYRAIEGFISDMEDFCYATNGQIEMLKDLRQTAIVEADKVMLTDAPLLFPPGQIALAVLHRANDELKVLDFERYLRSILSRQQSAHSISELNEAFNAIDILIERRKIGDNEKVRRIARKLKSCQDGGSRDDKMEKKSKHKSNRNLHEMQTTTSAAAQ